MHTPFLSKRGNRYRLRYPIPKRYQSIFGRKEIVVSLRTGDVQCAIERYVVELQKIKTQIYVLETRGQISLGTGQTADVLRERLDLRQIKASAIATEPLENVVSIFAHNALRVAEWPTAVRSQIDALASTVKSSLSWDELSDRFKKLDRDHHSLKLDKRARDKRYTPKQNAMDTFREFFPEVTNVLAITHQQALGFKDKLYDLVEAGKMQADTARRDDVPGSGVAGRWSPVFFR